MMAVSGLEQQGAVPYVPELEQQVLGAILLTPERAEEVAAHGGEDLFYDPAHKGIYKQVIKRHRAGMLASPVTLSGWAKVNEGLRELGGPTYLVRLAGAAISTSHLPKYVEDLVQYKARRTLAEALLKAQDAVRRGEDPPHIIAGRLEAEMMEVEDTGKTGPISMMKATTKAMEQFNAAYNGDTSQSVQTGISRVDDILGGMYNGDLILLGGRPSMGKTSVALSIGLNVARAGGQVCIASLEMNAEAMAVRAISEQTSRQNNAVYYSNIRRGAMTEPQFRDTIEAAKSVAELPIHFLSRQHADLGSLIAGAKQAKRVMGGMKLLIVDYAQLLTVKANSRYEEITKISMALKALAGQLDIPVMALSQLSRQLESRDDKRPMLSDLRESGQLEQDADTVMFCYRDEYYLGRQEPGRGDLEKYADWEAKMASARHRLEMIVAKQRQGKIGTAHVRCNPASNRIWED